MTPLERLLAEAIPTGTFGDSRPVGPTPPPAARHPVTAAEAAEHVRILEAELDLMEGRGTGKPERHLRPVPALTNTRKEAA